jgi:acetamidase/formamidase
MAACLPRERAVSYLIDAAAEPVLEVSVGETFTIETWDCSTGSRLGKRPVPTSTGPVLGAPLVNPLAGPIRVVGSEPGGTVAVEILDIEIDPEASVVYTSRRGPLADSREWPEVDRPRTVALRHEPGPSGTMRDGTVRFSSEVSWLAQPFLGTLAVSPARGSYPSVYAQGATGGNLDCRDFCPGNTVHLPCEVEGAQLYVGDVHASQGDMEYIGVAAETAATVTLRVTYLPQVHTPQPRVETPDSVIQLGIGRPLEHALSTAATDLLRHLCVEHGMAADDVYLLLSTHPDVRARVYQMLPRMPLQFVAGVEFPRSAVPSLPEL